MEENNREDAIRKLLDVVESRYVVQAQKINAERDARYRELSRRRCACMGRAATRLEILKEFASRKVRMHVKIYKSVAKEYRCSDILSIDRLESLRKEIATSARLECQTVKEMSERDCHAAGEWDQSAIDALARHYPVLTGHIEGVANTELRVLKAEAAARALLGQNSDNTRKRNSRQSASRRRLAPTNRRAAVDKYISEVLRKTGKRITRTDIWQHAHYKSRTEFERWESFWYERKGRKPNGAANERFSQILTKKPHLK